MAIRPDLPEIPAKLQSDCRDPGVPNIETVGTAVEALSANRSYAICSKTKSNDLRVFYRSVRTNFRGK